MKKIVSLIVFCLMITGFTQMVYGYFGETQKVDYVDLKKLPSGWMVKDVHNGYIIVDLNNAPYGATMSVEYLDNLPSGWVQTDISHYKYNIKYLLHDTTPPTAPANLQYTPTDSSVTLSWLASTDLVGVTGYNIYKDNIKIASTKGTSYTVNGLTPDTQYVFAVKATDAENESTPSVVSVKTIYDYTPPTSPTNLICAEKYDTSLKLSWSASTDNAAVAGYYIFQNSVKIGSTKNLSYAVTNLEHNSTYAFSIQAYDAVGNTSSSYTPSLTVLMDSNLTVVPYCAGEYSDGTKGIPCYWQGNTRVDLAGDGTHDAWACSLVVNSDTVYTAGYYYTGNEVIPCYWQGTTRVDLPTEGYSGWAFSMSASNGTVYTAGYYDTENDKSIPCYWKGSTRVDLATNNTSYERAVAIYVCDGTVYTAGFYSDASKVIPCYWKGSTRVDLAGDGTHDAYANSIFVNNDTVYTAGYYSDGSKRIPCYWKGSTRIDLAGDGTHDAYANSIFVNNDTVYTAGYYDADSKAIPVYWKGSTRVDLIEDGVDYGYANSICVNGDTVYMAGHYDASITTTIPCYWKGATRVDLAEDGTSCSNACQIFIPLTCN